MRRIILALIILMLPVSAYGWMNVTTCGGGVPVAAPTETCVGNTSVSGVSYTGFDNMAIGNGTGNYFVCPGTGTQNITEISAYLKSDDGTAGYVRLAVYDSSLNLVCQGNAKKSLTDTTAAWFGHTSSASELTGTCTCTGGNNYVVLATTNNGHPDFAYTASGGASFEYYKNSANCIDGFSDPMTSLSSFSNTMRVRFCSTPQ